MGFLELLKLRAGCHDQRVAAEYLRSAVEVRMPHGKTWLKMNSRHDSEDVRFKIEEKVENLVQAICGEKYDWPPREGGFYGPVLLKDELNKLKNYLSGPIPTYRDIEEISR